LLGPQFSTEEILDFLGKEEVPHQLAADDDELCELVADALAAEQVVGWMQGPMEFGPRALGGRSILGDPRSTAMQSVMNLKIKFRESFRPFAPSVLRNRCTDYFDIKESVESPYMLLVAPVNESIRTEPAEGGDGARGLDKLKEIRSELPAITHVDYSARVQTVDAERNPVYHKLITAFEKRTGCGALINTSFNVRGEPIVCTPEDAYRCFMTTNMDLLAMGNFILRKSEQPEAARSEIDEHLAKFALD
jgi:carbamoyltransferase